MTVIAYIVVSFSFGISLLLTFRTCAKAAPIPLTKALAETLFVTVLQLALFVLGQRLGGLLRFEDAQSPMLYRQTNELVFLGLMAVVAIRWTVSAFRKREEPSYDIARWSTVVALSVATGSSVLFVGLADGFLGVSRSFWALALPWLLLVFPLAYLGVMMGRRNKQLNPRRWRLLAVVMLLAVAIFSVVG